MPALNRPRIAVIASIILTHLPASWHLPMLVVFGRARDFSNFLTVARSPRFRNLHRMRSGIPRHRVALAMRQLVFRKWDNSCCYPLVFAGNGAWSAPMRAPRRGGRLQGSYAAHLIAIRDAAVIFPPRTF